MTTASMKDLDLQKMPQASKPEAETCRTSWGDLLIRCPEGIEFSQPIITQLTSSPHLMGD